MRYFEMKFPTLKIQHRQMLFRGDEESILSVDDVCDTSIKFISCTVFSEKMKKTIYSSKMYVILRDG